MWFGGAERRGEGGDRSEERKISRRRSVIRMNDSEGECAESGSVNKGL